LIQLAAYFVSAWRCAQMCISDVQMRTGLLPFTLNAN
jgi:hypothetical protein